MNFFPYLDEKLNYQLYLLIYGQHKVSWYEKFISKIQELILSTNQLNNYELTILLLLAIGLIILIGYEIFKKFITTLMRCNQRECHPVQEIKFSCENNDCEASGPSATSKSQENINNCEVIETSQQIPHVVNYEGYKKIYVLTFELDELPVEIARELNIQSENLDYGKYEAINQAQEIIMHIIDNVFSNLNSGDDCLSDELLSINPVSPNTASTQDNINNQLKYLYNQSRIYKLQPASRIPLLLKSQKQKFNKK